MQTIKYLILGAGLSGISAAYFLKNNFLLIDKQDRIGGLCKTTGYKNFFVDYSGHLLHFNTTNIKKLVLNKLLKNKYIKNQRKAYVYFQKKRIPYPFQNNLAYVNEKVIKNCLATFPVKNRKQMRTLHDFFINSYGSGLCKYFFFPYNKKLLCCDLRKLSWNQVSRFLPEIDKQKIIEGAQKIKNIDNTGYSSEFYYPAYGGIETLIKSFKIDENKILLKKYPNNIDLKKKIVILNDNTHIKYEHLISTIPLTELLKLTGLQEKVSLHYVSVLNVNILLRERNVHDVHWMYFPEKEYPFYRVGFYHNIADYLVPDKYHSSMYVEISYKRNCRTAVIEEALKKLIQLKFISSRRNIISIIPQKIKYAFVHFNLDTEEKLNKIRKQLTLKNVHLIGRYGNWEYSSMRDNIENAQCLAEKIIS